MQIRFVKTILFVLGGAITCSSGCVALNAPANLVKAFQKPKADRVQYAEAQEVDEVPDKLKDPEKLKLAYARWMEDMKQLGEARSKYEEVLKQNPKCFEATLGLARIDQATGHQSEAEQKFKKAVRLAPESSEAQNALGQFYAVQGDWKSALEPLTEAMLAAPENVNYRFQLAVALVHLGDVDSALPHFIRTVGDAEAHYNVAMILKEMNDFNAAEKHLMLAVTKKPDFKQAIYWLAQLRQNSDGEIVTDPNVLPNPAQPLDPNFHPGGKPSHSFTSNDSGISSPQPIARRQEIAALPSRQLPLLQ